MGELILLCGISASGKSTYAFNTAEYNPDKYIIVNRDKIRELLFGYSEKFISNYYKRSDIKQTEKIVTKYEDTLIYEGLNEGKTVIVDATHLERKYIERFDYWNVPTTLEFFDIDLETALERDLFRDRQVGEFIIKKQFQRYLQLKKTLSLDPIDFTPKILKNDITKPKCVILDIDGTISEPCERNIYDGFKAIDDILQPHIYNAIKNVENLIICTGRSDEHDEVTKAWLQKHNINYVKFYSRSKYDYRADWIVKERMWEDIAKDYYIDMMYEDRNSVVRRARSLGLKVAQVKYGNY